MRKIVFLLAFVAHSFLFAEDSPLVCKGEVPWMSDEFKGGPRYFVLASSSYGSLFFGDNKTVEIDKKNKIIKIWTIVFESYKSRDEIVKKYGQTNASLGYTKNFEVFDITNKKVKTLTSTDYTCNGNLIKSFSDESKWNYIIPDSVGEGKFETIKQKYGL